MNIRRICSNRGETFGKKIFWLQTLEDLEKMDASEIHPRKINAKEIIDQGKDLKFTKSQITQQKLFGRDHELREPTPRREQTVRCENFNRELQGEPGRRIPTDKIKK